MCMLVYNASVATDLGMITLKLSNGGGFCWLVA